MAVLDVLGPNAGVARVLGAGRPGPHAGMGILIAPRLVVTCAHVVNVALGRNIGDHEWPDAETLLPITFPMLASSTVLRAVIVAWRPPGFAAQDDIAILRLDEDAPADAGLAVLADVTAASLDDDALSVFGIGGGASIGNHVDAKFMNFVSGAWAQIDGTNLTGAFIQGGFSGAAVWDERHAAVVGMVVAKNAAEGLRVAYMIPVRTIRGLWQPLEIETRNLPEWMVRTWFVTAGVVFLLTLLHFLVERGAEEFALFTLTGGNKQLAELWGAQLYASLAWFPALLLFLYAPTRRLHPWWVRLPIMTSRNALRFPGTAKILGIVAIMALIGLPLYAQAHFLRELHDEEGRVSFNFSQWGYSSDDEVPGRDECRGGFCTLSGLGLYSLAPAGPEGRFGFLDNAYRYGDQHLEQTQSFYPLFQPLIIIAGTLTAIVLWGLGLWRVFRRPLYPSSGPR